MLKLNEEQRNYINRLRYGSLKIDDKTYYFKLMNDSSSYGLEMVAEELAKLVGIKCAHYECVEINGFNYYLSEDIGKADKFLCAYGIGIKGDSLYDIWNVLEKKCPKKVEYLMRQIVKIYIFDILILNDDRNFGNYGFKVVNGDLEDVYILDNDLSFGYGNVMLSSKFEYSDRIKEPISIEDVPDYMLPYSIDDLNYFLKTSSEEFNILFKSMFDILNPDTVSKVLEKLSLKNIKAKNKKALVDAYRENYELIGKFLNSSALKR